MQRYGLECQTESDSYPEGSGWENDMIAAVSGVGCNERQWGVEECFGAADRSGWQELRT